ncbi:MAG: cob(I)yrinic acid a,c-diamide adenosyltransferase [Clostridiales Family XIII bacterium]|jgi:cob(I)alamin adenosyltransferase|nr:cob(I)yrinic acid a,c-diamide adenosyltransferase [Clostridiales Family XIII bacterium]
MKGYVQIYTGNGKGKTTAALGLALRAVGAGKRVLFMQFMKAIGCSEHRVLKGGDGFSGFSDLLTWRLAGKPFFVTKEGAATDAELEDIKKNCVVFPEGNPPADYVKLISEAFAEAKAAAVGGEYDIVILDEINCAVDFGLLPLAEVLDLVKGKHEHTELVLTGRCAPQELIAAADLVTEMREVKHYYAKGVTSRRGIEG